MEAISWYKWVTHVLDIFETPAAVTPQQKFSKALNSSKLPSRYLLFTFGEIMFTLGGNKVFYSGGSGGLGGVFEKRRQYMYHCQEGGLF